MPAEEKWPRDPIPKDLWHRTTELRVVVNPDGKHRLQQLFTDFDSQSQEWRDVPIVTVQPREETCLRARSIQMRLAKPSKSDAEFILSLRTDPTKNEHLSETAPDVEAQRRWLEAYQARENNGTEFYFLIETLDGSPCGVVRVYDIIGEVFTWGSWILGANAPKTAAIESALLVYTFAYDRLGLMDCHFDVRLGNRKALAFHDRFGATRTHRDEQNQYFIYPSYKWAADKVSYAKFIT